MAAQATSAAVRAAAVALFRASIAVAVQRAARASAAAPAGEAPAVVVPGVVEEEAEAEGVADKAEK